MLKYLCIYIYVCIYIYIYIYIYKCSLSHTNFKIALLTICIMNKYNCKYTLILQHRRTHVYICTIHVDIVITCKNVGPSHIYRYSCFFIGIQTSIFIYTYITVMQKLLYISYTVSCETMYL